MLLRSLISLLIIFILVGTACGQQRTTPKSIIKPVAKTNPFQQVAVPDSVLRRINQAIKRQEKLDADAFPLYIFNLLDRKKFTFQDGIYSYRLSSPHAERRIFIVYRGSTTILEGIFVNDVLREYLIFVERKKLPAALTIRYLNVVSKYLDEEYNADYN